jgi:cytochrome c
MKRINQPVLLLAACGVLLCAPALGDQFTKEDLARWQAEYMAAVEQGEKLFHGGLKSKNTVSCDQCHPNATNIHPETYPKFQQQLGKVAVLGEMINWCIMNPLESEKLALDEPDMVDLQAYIHWERRGAELAPGKH